MHNIYLQDKRENQEYRDREREMHNIYLQEKREDYDYRDREKELDRIRKKTY